jgi:YVTN family beta-propeller protein
MLSSINARGVSSTSGRITVALLFGLIAIGSTLFRWEIPAQAVTLTRFTGPTNSQPLALSADGSFLAAVNPDNNTVSFFDVRNDRNRKLLEVPVETEPNGVAMLPNGSKTYVANTVSGTVSVLTTILQNGIVNRSIQTITAGTEPYSLVLTPNGRFLYVANARSNDITVINTATSAVITTIPLSVPEPRGLAVSNDGDDDDTDETLYVTHFLSLPVAGKVDGSDDAKEAFVSVISTGSNTVSDLATINPLTNTGFLANGDALARIPPSGPPSFTTGAYPNQLQNIAIKGPFAFVPNTCASPNGPVLFNVNTHSCLSVLNRVTNEDANQTINMHSAVGAQANPAKLFITNPWAIAAKTGANEAYIVSAASNIVVKLSLDPGSGLAAVLSDPLDPSRVLQIPTGKNPRGIVINGVDTRAYVMNYVSRSISVIKLDAAKETVLATIQSANLPAPGSQEDKIHAGKELYFTSVGVFDPAPGTTTPIRGRMSNNGWGSCGACHPFGLSDNVVWIFPSGPKRVIPQNTDFDDKDPTQQRILNWSAERDEEEDFSRNIRAVSGGAGLIVKADGVTPEDLANVPDLTPLSNANRNQLKIRGFGAWDAIKAFEQFGIRTPISPVPDTDPDVIAGRALFISANCQQCHGTSMWTNSRVTFTPPPDPSLISNGQIIDQLRQVGTFDPNFFNEVRQNGAPSIGADGFVPPSLLGLFAYPQTFFHNGAAGSLDEVMANVTHRSAGTGGVDTLTNAADRTRVVKFILSIDSGTVPIP